MISEEQAVGLQEPVPVLSPGEEYRQRYLQELKEKKQRGAERFRKIGLASIIYAAFYVFCYYKNYSGITCPVFTAGSIFYYCYCIKQDKKDLQKDKWYYLIPMMLFAVSTFLTDDGRIIFFNHMASMLLMASFLLHQYHADKEWGFLLHGKAFFLLAGDSVLHLFTPYENTVFFAETYKPAKNARVRYILLGILITLPVLLIVLPLLASADVMFKDIFLEDILRNISVYRVLDNMWGICWMFLLGIFIGYSLMAALNSRSQIGEDKDRRLGEPLVAGILTGTLSVIYLLFCGVQIVYLFAGRGKLPEGYTYAEYARQGFFQLLFVCLINLILVLICIHFFREHKVLKGILTVMCACTYIMIASSAFRMILYIRFYYLTFLRIFVLWALILIALLMAGVLLQIYKKKFPLFRYFMVVITICYLCLSYSHPDYWIARCNTIYAAEHTDFFFREETCDYSYLSGLSADAASILLRNDVKEAVQDEESEDAWERYYHRMQSKTAGCSIRHFNISRAIAEKMLLY